MLRTISATLVPDLGPVSDWSKDLSGKEINSQINQLSPAVPYKSPTKKKKKKEMGCPEPEDLSQRALKTPGVSKQMFPLKYNKCCIETRAWAINQ